MNLDKYKLPVTIGSATFLIVISGVLFWLGSDRLYSDTWFSSADVEGERQYTSPNYGYTVTYPISWKVEETVNKDKGIIKGQTVFQKNKNHVVVYVKSEISSDTLIPSPATRGQAKAVSFLRYHDYDPATGKALDRVVINRSDGLFFEIQGYGAIFERIVNSFVPNA